MIQSNQQFGPSWSIALYVLTGLFAIAEILNMVHIHILFLTTHAADVAGPALLYILSRKLWQKGSRRFPTRFIGRSPEITASVLFFACLITEISQNYFPHGIFPGRFDPWDIAAYAAGVGSCYILEKVGVGMLISQHENPGKD